jgi:hypothetical protein
MAGASTTAVVGIVPTTAVVIGDKESTSENRSNQFSNPESRE